jgi:hypothetical protein
LTQRNTGDFRRLPWVNGNATIRVSLCTHRVIVPLWFKRLFPPPAAETCKLHFIN